MQLDNLIPQRWELQATNRKVYLAISDKQGFSVYCLSFNLREKWYQTVVHLYDGGCKFTAVLEVTCLNVALKVSKSLIPQHWELQTVELHD